MDTQLSKYIAIIVMFLQADWHFGVFSSSGTTGTKEVKPKAEP